MFYKYKLVVLTHCRLNKDRYVVGYSIDGTLQALVHILKAVGEVRIEENW